ncbi:hypothetical protein CAPTEDRAFT_202345 [Capitella teleta]|uniref:Uncharacterized protein n=1 Tax=Capitella teleta TaxID=283909 RepID=R7TVJ9_CAPTE|nr:hypothetical protein CAPTEDRAFT_202345 [Capitella teleta]|eukprot:ELT97612.1 hypothetical protein CAPTEDRAFT_202345 [Capitella teleta]
MAVAIRRQLFGQDVCPGVYGFLRTGTEEKEEVIYDWDGEEESDTEEFTEEESVGEEGKETGKEEEQEGREDDEIENFFRAVWISGKRKREEEEEREDADNDDEEEYEEEEYEYEEEEYEEEVYEEEEPLHPLLKMWMNLHRVRRIEINEGNKDQS